MTEDYRSSQEVNLLIESCKNICEVVIIHDSKELENFLLIPQAIDRAVAARLADRARRGGDKQDYTPVAEAVLAEFASSKRTYITSQYLAARRDFERTLGTRIHDATLSQQVLEELDQRWLSPLAKLQMIPGKEALSHVNKQLQEQYHISITSNAIVDSMWVVELPEELSGVLRQLDTFASFTSKQ